jgi:hypothetical protein
MCYRPLLQEIFLMPCRLLVRAPVPDTSPTRWSRGTARALTVALFVLIPTLLATAPAHAQTADSPLRDRAPFGAYVPDLPGGRVDLPGLEADLGAKMNIASSFTDWSYVFGNANDYWMSAGNTRRVLYSWEPFGFRFTSVINGQQDAYLQRVADSMKAYPYDIYVRPWGEMNANWSSWQPTPGGEKRDGGTPAEFIAAWRHMVTFFHSRGVFNLKFMFNPDASDWSNNTPIPTIWPGAEFVDVIGIDGYNWGNDDQGNRWHEFEVIFDNMYNILTGLHATAPVWIAEYGSKEPEQNDGSPVDPNNNKGVWMTNMMSTRKFPRINGLAYFNVKKERDWRIQSSASSNNAMREQLAAVTPPGPTTTTTTAPTTTTTTRPPTTTTTTTGPGTTTTTRPGSTTTTTTTTTRPGPAPRPIDVKNPSLEEAGVDSIPTCWQPSGWGNNSPTWIRTPAGRTGNWSFQLIMANTVDGDRKLVIDQSNPACAPPLEAGTAYELSAWYYATAQPFFVAYYRDAAGVWQYWSESPRFAIAEPWARAVWTTPPAPAGATALSFGLALNENGVLGVDDFSAGALTTNVVPNPSLEVDTNNTGVPDCWQTAGFGTNTPNWKRTNDAHTGDWAMALTISGYVDGDRKLIVPTMNDPACAPKATPGKSYKLGAWYKSTRATGFVTYYRDASGQWQYWESGPDVAAASAWTQTTFQTQPLPAGATAISFGLSLAGNGTLTVDDHSMTE